MKKKITISYSVIVALLIMGFSLLCWISLAGNMHLKLPAPKPQKSFVSNVPDKTGSNELAASSRGNIISRIDSVINRFEASWSKSMYMKDKLSKLDSIFTYFTTGQISSSQVLKGDNNWLFYKSKSDGDSIADFEGTNSYTDAELIAMRTSAKNVQEYMEKNDIEFSILIAPNKENVYFESMPSIYTHAEVSRTDLLVDHLRNGKINIVSPKSQLLDEAGKYQLYYWYDTHWNELGAYLGIQSVMNSWGIDMQRLSNRDINKGFLKDNYHYCALDDLSKMVGLRFVFDDEPEFKVVGSKDIEWEQFEKEQNDGDYSHFHNSSALISSKIFLIGDSFRTAMVPELCELFADVYVVHREHYSVGMLKDIDPDYVICEYVERYSSQIKEIELLIS